MARGRVPSLHTTPPDSDEPTVADVSLVENELPLRWQRRAGLAPAKGLGTVRRAACWALVAWAPMAACAWLSHGFTGTSESFLAHYGVHVRLLLAVPLMILAEDDAQATTRKLLPHFVTSGLVPQPAVPGFRQAIADFTSLRDRTLPWVVILAVIVGGSTWSDAVNRPHEIDWAGDGSVFQKLGAVWFLVVARTMYLTLLYGWLWRLVLATRLLARISRLGLAIVPTHPDRAGGLGFLERLADIFAPVVFAASAVLASRWAHYVLCHGVRAEAYRSAMIAFVVIAVALFTTPLWIHAPALVRAKRRALLQYGALLAHHDRLVHERWVERRDVDDPMLSAPELGPTVDIASIYQAVRNTRPAPVGRRSITPLLVAAAVPMLLLLALSVPVGELVAKLLAALL